LSGWGDVSQQFERTELRVIHCLLCPADEIEETLADLAAIGVQIATIGQYLRPTERHLPVARYWEPSEFDDLAKRGKDLGLSHVQSSPLTRSSYHAREALGDATPVAAPSRR